MIEYCETYVIRDVDGESISCLPRDEYENILHYEVYKAQQKLDDFMGNDDSMSVVIRDKHGEVVSCIPRVEYENLLHYDLYRAEKNLHEFILQITIEEVKQL